MKKVLFAAFLFLILNNTSYSQFNQNSWEAGILITGGSQSTSGYLSDPGNSAFFNMNILPAFFLFNGFSIEPQFEITATEDIQPEFNIIGNLSYTYHEKNSQFAPYLSAGYGFANSVNLRIYGKEHYSGEHEIVVNQYHSDEFDIGVFNTALGIKFLVNKKVALRSAVNYKIYNVPDDSFSLMGIEGPDNRTITQLSFLGGLSFLF